MRMRLQALWSVRTGQDIHFRLMLRQTPVDRRQGGIIVADKFQVLDDLLSAFLLFELLIDEPLLCSEGVDCMNGSSGALPFRYGYGSIRSSSNRNMRLAGGCRRQMACGPHLADAAV